MLVHEALTAGGNGSVIGRDGSGENDFCEALDLNLGGKGLDKNSGDEEGKNTGERGCEKSVTAVPLTRLGATPFEARSFEVLSPRRNRFLLLRLLLRLLSPDPSPIEDSDGDGSLVPLDGSENRRGR